MNAPAETAPAPATNPAYLHVLEALVSLNEPADRERIATKAGISYDDAGVQLVALSDKRIASCCPQPKGAPALWSLAVSLSTARQMVEGMKRAAAEAGPGADDRRRIIAAMCEIGAPASAFGIAKKSGVDLSVVSVMLEAMTADGTVQRIPGSTGQRPKFALAPSVQPRMPTATDGEPGDDEPAPEPGDTQAEDRRRAVLEALREAPEANADSIASATGLSVSEARFFLHAMAADGIVERIEHENAGSIRRNPTIWRIVDADQPGDTQAVDAVEAAPVSDHAASLDDPDNFGDDEMPAAAPDPDGWIPWHGGDCPVPEGVACWARLRDGSVVFADKPLNLAWGRCDILASPERRAVAPDEPLSPVWVRRNHPRDIVAYRLDKPAHLITPAYAYAVATESAADSAPLTGTDVCSADAVIADWKREHAPAAPAIAPADPFAVWLADTPAGCAGQRAIDAAEQEAARLEAEAAEMAREAAETRQRGLIVAEIIRFADQRNVSTSTADADFGLAELLAAAYEAVTGKRVA